MKKFLFVIIALCLISPLYAEMPKSMEKALIKEQKKEMKKKKKEYEKEGWKIMGSHTMEVALLKHFGKLIALGDCAVEFNGPSNLTKSKNTGEQMAINNATIKYAQRAGSTVKGRVLSDIFADGTGDEGEYEKFFAAYERLVEQKVKNMLTPSYTIYRQNPDGTYEVQAIFILDENKAHLARKAALENAIEESELAGEYADKVSSYAGDRIDD